MSKDQLLALSALEQAQDPAALAEHLRIAIEREQEERQKFVDELSPEVKAEWIRGKPVYHSPARHAHNAAVHALSTLLGNHRLAVGTFTVTVEKQMIELKRSNYEPDVAVWLNATHVPEPDQVIYPPCDLVVEVLSKNTKTTDRKTKFADYAEAGILEYWIVDADAETIEQYSNDGGAYRAVGTFRSGNTITSLALPDFSIDAGAVFNFDRQTKEARRLLNQK